MTEVLFYHLQKQPLERVLPELDADAREFMLRATTQEVSYMTTALGMVASGLGLTVCPTYSASLVRAHGLQMVRLDQPDFHREVCVYGASKRSLSPAAASFVELLEGFVHTPGLAG